MSTVEANKALVREHMRMMVEERRWDVAIDTFIDEDIIQHNPEMRDGAAAVRESVGRILSENPDASYDIKYILAEDDLVALFGHFRLSPDDRGTAAFDMFRVRNGRIIEHWDILQPIAESAENDNSMF